MLELSGLETLRNRRIMLTDKFATKCINNPRFSGWFPETSGRRSARRKDIYLEQYARCERLRNSPIFYMRRRLNGKEGKRYGERQGYFGPGVWSRSVWRNLVWALGPFLWFVASLVFQNNRPLIMPTESTMSARLNELSNVSKLLSLITVL